MKKLTKEKAERKLKEYFESRKVPKRDPEGNPVIAKTGEILYEERPCTVTGIALALGLTGREELEKIREKKTRAVVDRALLRVEESAEEKLFSKETAAGAKLFLSVNFKRWSEGETSSDENGLGVCTVWAE